jgi:amphi-Trp domain-containing protein
MVKKKAKAVQNKTVTTRTGRRSKAQTRKTGTTTSSKSPPAEAAQKKVELISVEKTRKEKKKTRVKFKSAMLREEAISYFEAIVAGLKRGSVQIRQGDNAITLSPTPQLDVSVKAASKDEDESIKFEIRWRTASDSELTISTD